MKTSSVTFIRGWEQIYRHPSIIVIERRTRDEIIGNRTTISIHIRKMLLSLREEERKKKEKSSMFSLFLIIIITRENTLEEEKIKIDILINKYTLFNIHKKSQDWKEKSCYHRSVIKRKWKNCFHSLPATANRN